MIRHAALVVQDIQRAVKFYTESLGFRPYHVSDPDWAMVERDGSTLSLVKTTHPSHLGLTLSTPSEVDRFHAKLSETGLREIGAPVKHRDGSYGFYFRDTEGNQLECIFIPAIARLRTQKTGSEGVVLLAHGSRDPEWTRPFIKLQSLLKLHLGEIKIAVAYMEMAQPSLEQAVSQLLQENDLKRIHIFPIFLASGGHMKSDVPQLIDELRARHPDTLFETSEAIGEAASVQDAITLEITSRLSEKIGF